MCLVIVLLYCLDYLIILSFYYLFIYLFIILVFVYAFVQLFRIWFCLVSDVTSFGAYASRCFILAYWKLRHVAHENIITLFIFTGCSSQHKSSYLFLDKGQVAENLKQSIDSILIDYRLCYYFVKEKV